MIKPYTTKYNLLTKDRELFKEYFKDLKGVKVKFVKERLYPDYSNAIIELPSVNFDNFDESMTELSRLKKKIEQIKLDYRLNHL